MEVTVEIIGASCLPEVNGKCQSFVEIQSTTKSWHKTKVYQSAKPIWNEKYSFPLKDTDKSICLLFHVNKDVFHYVIPFTFLSGSTELKLPVLSTPNSSLAGASNSMANPELFLKVSCNQLDYRSLYFAEKQKVEDLQTKLVDMEKHISQDKRPKYGSQEENDIAYIQRAWKRRQQSSQLTSLVSQFSNSTLGKKLKERNSIIREIVKTEEVYVRSLQEIQKHYVEPLKLHLSDEKTKKKMLTDKEFRLVFGNLEQILAIHDVFLQMLRQRMDQWPLCTIGDCIYSVIPLFFMYVTYVTNYDESLNILRDLSSKSKEFSTFVMFTRKKASGQLDLKALLILPIQRIPRYILLLRELLKNTDESHIDYQNIVKAKRKLEKLTMMINEKKRKHESLLMVERTRKLLESVSLNRDHLPPHNHTFHLADKIILHREGSSTEHQSFYCMIWDDIILLFTIGKKSGSTTSLIRGLVKGSSRKSVATAAAGKDGNKIMIQELPIDPLEKSKEVFDEELDEHLKYHSHYPLKNAVLQDFEDQNLICLDLLSQSKDNVVVYVRLIFEVEQQSATERKNQIWHEKLGDILHKHQHQQDQQRPLVISNSASAQLLGPTTTATTKTSPSSRSATVIINDTGGVNGWQQKPQQPTLNSSASNGKMPNIKSSNSNNIGQISSSLSIGNVVIINKK